MLKPLTILAALAVAASALVGTVATATAGAPQITHFTLSNGLEVVVIPDHRAPVVTHMLWYKVGSADETAGKSGLAHFLEHLMFKGTDKNPSGRFSQVVATIGGQENAFTSADYTGYFQRVPRDKLKQMMEFEADRMTGLALTDDVVRPELNVVLEEQNMRVANNPAARLGEQMDAALYLNHPYGRPVIGWRHEIEQLDREGALAFYRRFYAPNNAILVVAGDVTADEVRTLAEETYGKIPRFGEIKPRLRPQEPVQQAARTVTLADPRVTQPNVSRYYLVPSSSTARPGESEALDVLAHILGRGANSRTLSEAGGGQEYRGERGCELRRHRGRQHALRHLRHAEARNQPAAARTGDRRRHRRSRRERCDRRGTRALEEPHDRRCHLCQ